MFFDFHPFPWQKYLSQTCLMVIFIFSILSSVSAQDIGSNRLSRVLPNAPLARLSSIPLRNYYFNDWVGEGVETGLRSLLRAGTSDLISNANFLPLALRPDDQIWLVNGRNSHHFPDASCLTEVAFLDPCQSQWRASDLSELVADHSQQKSLITVIYSHGDRTDEFYSVHRGIQFYQNVFSYQLEKRPPIRYVIWSWQSEKEYLRPAIDFRVKATRSRIVGSSLASLLMQFPDDQLVLVGYSLGCQAFLDAFKTEDSVIKECDSLAESKLSDTFSPDGGAYRLALIAPALDGNYVANQRCRWPEYSPVAQLEIFDNRQDYALRVAKKIGRRTVAGGDWPINCLAINGNLPAREIALWEIGDLIGHRHSIVRYSQVPIIRQRISELVFSMRPNLDAEPTDSTVSHE